MKYSSYFNVFHRLLIIVSDLENMHFYVNTFQKSGALEKCWLCLLKTVQQKRKAWCVAVLSVICFYFLFVIYLKYYLLAIFILIKFERQSLSPVSLPLSSVAHQSQKIPAVSLPQQSLANWWWRGIWERGKDEEQSFESWVCLKVVKGKGKAQQPQALRFPNFFVLSELTGIKVVRILGYLGIQLWFWRR